MALKSVADLKSSISGLLQGMNIENVTNLNGAIERGARTMVQQADVPEASGIEGITLYGGVNFYEAPQSLFGGAINIILPQGAAPTWIDYNYKVQLDTFSRGINRLPNGYMLTVTYDKGIPLLGVTSPNVFPQAIIDPMNSTDGWTAAGSASGLTTDTTNYYEQPASLRFSLAGASTGTLTKTLTNSNDWSIYEGVGVAFLAIYTPSIANLTNIELRLGSDSGNYDSVTSTEGFLGAWVVNEWLLVAFDQASATSTGTPDWSAIDYVQVRVTTSGAITNFRVGGLWLSLPCPHNIYYQTAAIFKDASTGVLSETITDDSNIIILSNPAYTLLEHEAARTIYLQSGGGAGTPMYQTLERILYDGDVGLYNKYRANNPSSQLRTIESYYD